MEGAQLPRFQAVVTGVLSSVAKCRPVGSDAGSHERSPLVRMPVKVPVALTGGEGHGITQQFLSFRLMQAYGPQG